MNNNWDDILNKLRSEETPLSDGAWQNMDAKLNQAQPKRKKALILWWLVAALAAGFTVILPFLGDTDLPKKAAPNQEIVAPITAPSTAEEIETESKTEQNIDSAHLLEDNNIQEEKIEVVPADLSTTKKKSSKKTVAPKIEKTFRKPENIRALHKREIAQTNFFIAPSSLLHFDFNQPEIPLEKKATHRGFELKLYTAATYNFGKTQQNIPSQNIHKGFAEATQNGVKPGFGFDAGVEVSYYFSKQLKLGTGLTFREIVTQNDYGYSVKLIPVIDSASGRILGYLPTQEPQIYQNNSSNKYLYFGVPIGLYYEFDLWQKWSATAEFINTVQFLVRQNSVGINPTDLTLNPANKEDFANAVVSYQLRLGLQYQLWQNTKVALQPAYRSYYSSLYSGADKTWKPKDFALNLALIYKF